MPLIVEISDLALSQLKGIRTHERRRIVDAIYQQLEHQPTMVTLNRKCLKGAEPDFEHVPPLWELRVGDYRVFYDVYEGTQTVFVRVVLRKDPRQTTGDIIHERSDS